jgi:hypothetical protein
MIDVHGCERDKKYGRSYVFMIVLGGWGPGSPVLVNVKRLKGRL